VPSGMMYPAFAPRLRVYQGSTSSCAKIENGMAAMKKANRMMAAFFIFMLLFQWK